MMVFIAYSRLPFAYLANTGKIKRYLILGYNNPNMTAILVFLTFGLSLITMPEKRKVLTFVMGVASSYLIWLTEARAIIIAQFALVIISMLMKRGIPKWLVYCACFLPFVIAVVYPIWYTIWPDFEFLGKPFFSGRQFVYAAYLSKINSISELFIGSFEHSALQNAHNGPLAIFTSAGAIGLFTMYSVMIGRLMHATEKEPTRIRNMAIVVLLACFVHSSGEAFLFLGAFPGIVFIYLFYVFATAD